MDRHKNEEIVKRVGQLVEERTGRSLTPIQIGILRESLKGNGYVKMARTLDRSADSLRKEAAKLWKLLGSVLGQPVTKPRLREVLESSLFSLSPPTDIDVDWPEAPDVRFFLGRKDDLTTLRQWITIDRCRLIPIVGLPGKGKTSLAVKLTQQLGYNFQGIIGRSLLNAPPVEDIIRDWIQFISHQQNTDLPDTLHEQISLVISYLQQNRYLLILDNFETLLTQGIPEIKYKSGYENYHQLLDKIAQVNHQSCLLLTSRAKIGHLETLSGNHQPVRFFQLKGLTVDEGKRLFEEKGQFSATEAEWRRLIDTYKGNPLALKLAASHIQDSFSGNIGQFLQFNKFCFRDLQEHILDWHFQVSSPEEHRVLFWLAIHREPVSVLELKDHVVGDISQQHLSDCLQSLRRRMLIEHTDDRQRFTLQPALMEYVTEKLIESVAEEIVAGEFNLFRTHGLRLAKAKDYIQSSQVRVIVDPVIAAVSEKLQILPARLPDYFTALVAKSQQKYAFSPGYIGGNLIHLLCQLDVNLDGYDFSKLAIWQANLQGISLRDVNFSGCDFKNTVFTQFFGGVHALDFSPDGGFLATGDSEGMIRLVNLDTGQPELTFGKHRWWVVSLVYSPDGEKLVSSSLDYTVKIWNARNGQLLYTLQGHEGWVWSVAYHPILPLIASGCNDRTIKFWDANSGKLLQTITGHDGWVLGVAFSPDGRILASGSSDRTIKLWDVKTGQVLQTIWGSRNAIWCVQFSPNGDKIASCGFEKIIRVWDVETGKCDRTLSGHEKEIKVLAWSTDSQSLASGGFDAQVRFWAIAKGRCRAASKQYKTGIRTLAFSPDNQTVATGDNDQIIKLWNSKNGKCMQTLRGHTNWVWSLAVSPDGEFLASSHLDHKVRLWNPKTGDCLQTLTGHTAWVWSVAFSPDGKTVASSGDDETIRLWDVETGDAWEPLRYHTEDYQGGIWTISFSRDGLYLASGGQDSTVKIWDLQTGDLAMVLPGHEAWIWSVAFHPLKDEILASASDDKTIKIWNLKTGDCLQTFRGHKNSIRAIAFSRDSRFLLSGSEDETVKIWDLKDGDCRRSLSGHEGRIWSVDWSADGRVVGSGGDDATFKLWDVKTGDCLHTIDEHQNTVTSVMFDRKLPRVMTGSSDGTLKFWHGETGRCLRSVKIPNIYLNMNIENATGLIDAQIENLQGLGAIADEG